MSISENYSDLTNSDQLQQNQLPEMIASSPPIKRENSYRDFITFEQQQANTENHSYINNPSDSSVNNTPLTSSPFLHNELPFSNSSSVSAMSQTASSIANTNAIHNATSSLSIHGLVKIIDLQPEYLEVLRSKHVFDVVDWIQSALKNDYSNIFNRAHIFLEQERARIENIRKQNQNMTNHNFHVLRTIGRTNSERLMQFTREQLYDLCDKLQFVAERKPNRKWSWTKDKIVFEILTSAGIK